MIVPTLMLVLAAGNDATFTKEATAQYRDAVAKVTAGSYGPATEVLNALAAQYPRVPEVFATRCSAQLGLRRYKEAEADCAYAVGLRPNLPSALYGLAMAEDNQQKVDAAITHYRKYAALSDPQAVSKPQAAARADVLEGQNPLPVAAPPPMAPGPAPVQAAVAGTGTLLIYRNHLMAGTRYGGVQQVSLALDGKPVGDIAHDQYVEVIVPAGSHLLEARFAVDNIFEVAKVLTLPVDLAPNASTYVNFDYVGGQMQMRLMPAAQGRKEIQEDCTKAYTRRM